MKLEDTMCLLLPLPLTLKLLPGQMSDMRAGPSALPSPGSWQFESVREQRGIWIVKSPCMLLGRNEAKGGEGNILQML